jgi:hypothetical protein
MGELHDEDAVTLPFAATIGLNSTSVFPPFFLAPAQ